MGESSTLLCRRVSPGRTATSDPTALPQSQWVRDLVDFGTSSTYFLGKGRKGVYGERPQRSEGVLRRGSCLRPDRFGFLVSESKDSPLVCGSRVLRDPPPFPQTSRVVFVVLGETRIQNEGGLRGTSPSDLLHGGKEPESRRGPGTERDAPKSRSDLWVVESRINT